MLETTRPQIARNGDSENGQPAISPRRQTSMRGPGISENDDQNGSSAPKPSTRLQAMEQFFKRLMENPLIPLGISIVALVFGILSVYASWKALDLARAAYSQEYWAYEAQKIANRLSLMQLCALNLTKYADTCANVETWDYLPYVYNVVYPGGGGVPEGQPPVHLAFKAKEAASTLGATAGLVFLIAIAMLVWPI